MRSNRMKSSMKIDASHVLKLAIFMAAEWV